MYFLGARKARIPLLALSLAYSSSAAFASSITINAIDSGSYNEATGSHVAQNENYIAGLCPQSDCSLSDQPFRNFFVFDLSAITDSIVSAVLQVDSATVYTDGTYNLYDVSTDIQTLRAGGFGLTEVWTDLGTGTSFGSTTISAGQDNTLLTITLNSAAIAALNAAAGDLFAIGGDYQSAFAAFAFSNSASTRQLVLETTQQVPEPEVLPLLGIGLVALMAPFRRRGSPA